MRKGAALAISFLAVVTALGGSASSDSSEYRNIDAQLLRRYRDADLRYGRAKVKYEKKDLEGTRKELDACLQLIPEFAEAHLLKAKVLYLEKEYERALAEVKLAKTGHDATASLVERMQQDRMSEMRRRGKEKDEAISALRTRMAQARQDEQMRLQLQISDLEAEKTEINRILTASALGPDEVPAEYHFFHGNVLLRLKSYSEAAVQYEEALRVNPAYGEAANNLASLYYSAKQYEKALAVVTKAEGRGVVVNPELKKAIEEGLRKPK